MKRLLIALLIAILPIALNAQAVGNGGVPGGPTSGVSSVTGTSPIVSSGGATPAISIGALTGAQVEALFASATGCATAAYVLVPASGTCVAPSGVNTTFTNATTAIGGNACSASAVTVTMTGVTTASVFIITPSTDVSGSTGWGSTGGLVIDAWPTANTLNYKICNQTSSSITPTAVTWNVGAK